MSGSATFPARRRAYDGTAGDPVEIALPVEAPVAIEINGMAYAVMMATPIDLEDFVTGFLLGEGLAEASEIGAIALHAVEDALWGTGHVARVTLPAHRLEPVMRRARGRVGDSACGICGIESVEAALRPLPGLERRTGATPEAIARALHALRERQPLGRETRASHAAGFAGEDGTLLLVREDVGRHNALDKLLGALAREGRDPSVGFVVMTSRCSYELVEKAARAGVPLLVAISAPTDLAVCRAHAAGLSIAAVARDDTMLWMPAPE
ncbi:formate dehydrogenase accessory sulfurtransferase FdhD [Novosphingobium sp. 9]|uniref:formate dehydrogenase accessory sulfurtransferase FdhD n=1 Tax=Novosphingobium sp. 9 TaxID=2025349 RepID=UPI0021B1BD2E|nr:formate dehydrogenase accessory sulfurtransferase FdhD [Novosphingobium sp. 9]